MPLEPRRVRIAVDDRVHGRVRNHRTTVRSPGALSYVPQLSHIVLSLTEINMNANTLTSVGLLVMAWSAPGIAGQTSDAAAASERFEVTSIKAVRPTLVDTI